MSLFNSLFNGTGKVLNYMESSIITGYSQGENNLKKMNDKQLKDKIIKNRFSTLKGLSEQSAYLDEAKKRNLFK